MIHHLAHPPQPPVAVYVDGGVALVRSPYDAATWRSVREAWWWHVAAMIVFPPYAVVALVLWQRPSGQPLGRRVVWAVFATAGAVVLVGLGAFVVFSRRWYWWHRTGAGVEEVVSSRPGGGPLAHRAAAVGGRLVDRCTGEGRRRIRPGLALAWLPAPWGELRDQVAAAAVRVHQVHGHLDGPAAEVVERAADETAASLTAASEAAERAALADRCLAAFDPEALAADLRALASSSSATDLEAARRALHAQQATVARTASALAATEGRLRRLAAQSGEVAARAEELTWVPSAALDGDVRALEAVTDQLEAVRSALDQLDQLDLATGVA